MAFTSGTDRSTVRRIRIPRQGGPRITPGPDTQHVRVTNIAGAGVGGQFRAATLSTNLAGNNNDLTYTAKAKGAAGNSIRVRYVVAGNDTALSVAVSGSDITVNSATDSGGAATSTATQVKDAIDASAPAAAKVSVANKTGNDGTGVIAALAYTNLTGGTDWVIGQA